jgi:hypothetical protein
MRIHLVAIALIFTAGCGDNGGMANVKNDLSMGEPDLSMGGGEDFAMPGDFATSPDLTPETPSQMIQSVRNAGDSNPMTDGGVLTMALPVADVFVTYLRPEVAGETDDPPAFFVQADPKGPALLIRVNPSSLSPAPLVGDKVKFTVTSAGKDSGGVHQALTITDWAVESSGNDLSTFVQDLSSATDLVSGINNYESELSKVTGTVNGGFSSSGNGYVQAAFSTAVLVSPSPLPELRVPSGVRDSLDLTNGCVITVGPTPMWRFNKLAQPAGWVDGDISVTSCPAPQVLSARATSSTTVVVTFDRELTVGTVTMGAFTFTSSANAITTSSVSLTTPTTVTVTTSAQTTPQLYTVHVAASVEDTKSQGVDAAHNSFTFNGFALPATLVLSEVNPDISGKHDLVELRVVNGGSVAAFNLYQGINPTPASNRVLLDSLPDIVVATNDIIVVHLNPDASVVTETNINGASACPVNTTTNCSAAWDVAAPSGSDIAFSARFVTLTDANGAVQDAMAFTNKPAATSYPVNWTSEMKYATANSFWGGTCPNSCAANTDADTLALDVSSNTTGVQNTVAGRSAQRLHNDNTVLPAAKANWKIATSTWGTATP